MERYVCIHGHFYQPPRENPWLEEIELQDSAYPFHDWNERITEQCYAPNAASRILDGDNKIIRIVNNYAKISFNFGPTLLSWLEDHDPDAYQGILRADRESQQNFSGHGSALAQAYNHMILPLANRRDKETQVLWGIRDFEHRFGREPEGLWLPETAADTETLEVLAEMGIRFIILAPGQARRVRKIGTRNWRNVSGAKVDPSMPYEVRLPSGGKLAIFFYDGPISQAVAFEGLLSNGENFARRLLDGFNDTRTWPQIVHIATDGESYGHHHIYGDMALAYALQYIESQNLARLTNYGEFLERHPPTHEVEIIENSSWSCAHGVERWRSDCGCNSGGHPGWNQAWRAPLRESLDWLRDTVAPLYEEHAGGLVTDPWAARNEYISVVLDRSPENVEQFFARSASHDLCKDEKVRLLKLLELQRHAMLMYTSCGWFFDEISGIETVQILQYAGRVAQLAQEVFGDHIEAQFIGRLAAAKSNIPENRDGARIYAKFVEPAKVDLKKVGAHYAVNSLFETYEPSANVYCYSIEQKQHRRQQSGRAQVAVGVAQVTSRITRESTALSFAVLYFGDHNLSGAVREFQGMDAYQAMRRDVLDAFAHADLPQVIRLLDTHFGGASYSLKSLFRDEQRKVLDPILTSTLAEVEAAHRQIYESHALLMRYLVDLGIPLPKPFQTSAEIVLTADFREALSRDDLDIDQITTLRDEARSWNIKIDGAGLGRELRQMLERMILRLRATPQDRMLMRRLEAASGLIRSSPFAVDLWKIQNIYYEMLQDTYPDFRQKADQGDATSRAWADRFKSLGDKLGIRVLA